jgi:hypothetical protein
MSAFEISPGSYATDRRRYAKVRAAFRASTGPVALMLPELKGACVDGLAGITTNDREPNDMRAPIRRPRTPRPSFW